MEQSGSSTMLAIDGCVHGAQEHTTPPPGKTQAGRRAGRSVQCKATVIQTSCQEAAASNTSQRTTRECAVVATNALTITVHEAINTGKLKAFEIRNGAYEPTDELRTLVDTALNRLRNEKRVYGENSLPFWQSVTEELDYLTSKIKGNKDEDRDYEFIMSQLGPQYKCGLPMAMKKLKSIADEKRSWEYCKDLISMIKYLDLQQDEYPEESFDKQLTGKLCEQFLRNEICYMEYLTDFPVEGVASNSFMIFDRILNALSESPLFDLMDKDALARIKNTKHRLTNTIKSNTNKGSADKHLQKAEQDLSEGSTDIQDKRRYNDLLRVQLAKITRQNNKTDTSISERFLMLKKSCALRVTCMRLTGEYHDTLCNITALISAIAKQILKQGMDNFVQFKKETLDLIDRLMTDDLLSDECGRLYLRCRETQAVRNAIVRTNKITGDQYTTHLDEIDSLAKKGTEDCAMQAADMLGGLLYGHWHKIKKLDTADLQLIERIQDIEDMLATQLFRPITDKFKVYVPVMDRSGEYHLEMSKHRHRVMKLSPYTFVIRDKELATKWPETACAAWYCDIDRLSKKQSFTEEDIDCLLDLKRAVPDVPDLHVRGILEETCKHLFHIILENKDHDKKIPFHKLDMLHQWMNKIATLRSVSKKHHLMNKAELAKINDAWKRKYEDTTARVTSCQPVSDAVPIWPEPKALSPHERKSSSTPPTKAPAVTVLKPDVIYPESRADFKKGKSRAVGFPKTAKQLAAATTSMATVTAQVSRADHSSLQDARRPSSRTDKHVSQPTVTAPVKMMTADSQSGITANRSFRKTQDGITLPPWKTQTGRVVHETKAVRILGQMAVASSSSRQTTSNDYAMAVAEPIAIETTRQPIDVEESHTFEIVECKYQPTPEFRLKVEDSLKFLEKKATEPGSDPFLFCRTVAIQFRRLKAELKIPDDAKDDNYKFMERQLGPHYTNSLNPALNILKSELNAQRGWKYSHDFTAIMKLFYLQTDEMSITVNRELLEEVYHLFIQNELKYWRYIKDSLLSSFGSQSDTILCHLLQNNKYPFRDDYLLPMDLCECSRVNKERKSLVAATGPYQKHDNDAIDEHIEKLEKKILAGHADVLDKRLYSNLLQVRIKDLAKECYKESKSVQEVFLILKEIYVFYRKCSTLLDKSDTTGGQIRRVILASAKAILLRSVSHIIPLEKEVLDFIHNLMINNLLSNSCNRLYLQCKETQAEMKPITQTDKITDDQCIKKITEIRSFLEQKTRADYLVAAGMLKRLLHEHWQEITMLPSASSHLDKIKTITSTLHKQLFMPVVNKFEKYKAASPDEGYNEEYNKEMDEFRPVLIELSPYSFTITGRQDVFFWKMTVCAAWDFSVKRLSKIESFEENDVDCLLDLKHIAPDVPNPSVRIHLGIALKHFFSILLHKGNGDIPLDKIMAISQWIDDLACINSTSNHNQEDDSKLKELNEIWKRKNRDTTARVTSDQPVSDAALVRPETGELFTVESGSSFTPPTKNSAATVSGTDVVFS